MLENRLIPVLLLSGKGLVKTVKFKNPKYVGDPINAIKIFNDKEVDELVFLDIKASKENRGPNFELLKNICSECFMPLAYGGGITKLEEVEKLYSIGFEKVIINNSAFDNPNLIKEAVRLSGSQSIIGCVDYKKSLFGKKNLYTHKKGKVLKISVLEYINQLIDMGIGEIIIQSVDNDGMMNGFDVDFLNDIASKVNIPVVGVGGAGNIDHIKQLLKPGHVSAAAAGSMFVFHGPHKAVLINYPNQEKVKEIFNNNE